MNRKKQTIKKLLFSLHSYWQQYREWRFRYQLLLPASIVGIAYVASTLDRPIVLAYGTDTCMERSTILPGLFRPTGKGYQAYFANQSSVATVPLVADQLCVKPIQSPQPGKTEPARLSLFGVPFLFQKGFKVTAEALPRIDSSQLKDGLAVSRPLVLAASVTDTTFDYKLSANNKTVACIPDGAKQSCDVARLELRQATPYKLKLERYFEGQLVDTVFERAVTTLSPVSVAGSSIKPSEMVYSRPTAVELQMDKRISSAEAVLEKREGDKLAPITVKTEVNGQTIKASFAELPRSSQYQLTLRNVVASDGSTLLDKTYAMAFSTSGGPKVIGVNIGRTSVGIGTTVVVTFDQNLSPSQDIAPFVRVAGGLSGATKQGNQLRFSTSSVPVCGDFSISLTRDLQSEHGVAGDSAWSYGSRTLCQVVGSIGATVKGRSITSYRFGSGPNIILFVGATHGNEAGTYQLLSLWIDELESKARSIPADKTVIVIPALNRDGLAAGSRRNANNVDLNRNFPTADWKADVTMPGGEMVQGGGGSAPLSEPESQSIANYTTSLSPRLVLTYHSTGSLVTPNEAGVSSEYASTYSSISGYYVSPKASASETFEYDTTGAYEDWLYEKPGIAAILVELGSHTSHSSSRNFPAMWAMLK